MQIDQLIVLANFSFFFYFFCRNKEWSVIIYFRHVIYHSRQAGRQQQQQLATPPCSYRQLPSATLVGCIKTLPTHFDWRLRWGGGKNQTAPKNRPNNVPSLSAGKRRRVSGRGGWGMDVGKLPCGYTLTSDLTGWFSVFANWMKLVGGRVCGGEERPAQIGQRSLEG